MPGPVRALLPGGRWHFQHGPIDCLVHAEGDVSAVARATERSWARFETVLAELVSELPLLRADLSEAAAGGRPLTPALSPEGRGGHAGGARGAVARTMIAACRRHARDDVGRPRFITAMAAVAGSVADHLVSPFAAEPGVVRAFVNNGGDIALHLAPGARYDVGVCADLARGLAGHAPDGRFAITRDLPVRGIATSGWRGRSFSLGIADAVTVLAATGAEADAAATVIANAVDVASAAVVRRPANAVRDDSDLGERLVVVAVGALSTAEVAQALNEGLRAADRERRAGRIVAAVLQLAGRVRVCAADGLRPLIANAALEAEAC